LVKPKFYEVKLFMTQPEVSIYELIGGEATLRRLVDVFYAKVAHHAALRAIFPADLEAGKQWQFLFLMHYWGNSPEYLQTRGHPRLRMRHAPFPITPQLRDAWLLCMFEAIDEVGIHEPARTAMREYFERAAAVMVNRPESETL
jgi:hemoglobin